MTGTDARLPDDVVTAIRHEWPSCGCDSCQRVHVAVLVHEMRKYPTLKDLLAAADAAAASRREKFKRRPISPGLQRRVWDRDGWECRHCGDHRDLTVDHIVPVSKGGTNDFGNLQTLCMICNTKKGNREEADRLREIFAEAD